MQIYIAATPEEMQQASCIHRPLAHVAYRIGPDSVLLRQNLLLQARGGLLSISDRNSAPINDPDALCEAVLRECSRRSYAGALLDFESVLSQDRADFIQQLDHVLHSNRKALYIPEACASVTAPHAVTLICTAVSGGNFREHLQEAVRRKGSAAQLGLDIQRTRMDFSLPSPSGTGMPLSAEAFQNLLKQESPSIFFSPDLCARYFTYNRDGNTHFVLFDDAGTLMQKIRIGTSMGFSAAFFMWPEIKDLAQDLFR